VLHYGDPFGTDVAHAGIIPNLVEELGVIPAVGPQLGPILAKFFDRLLREVHFFFLTTPRPRDPPLELLKRLPLWYVMVSFPQQPPII